MFLPSQLLFLLKLKKCGVIYLSLYSKLEALTISLTEFSVDEESIQNNHLNVSRIFLRFVLCIENWLWPSRVLLHLYSLRPDCSLFGCGDSSICHVPLSYGLLPLEWGLWSNRPTHICQSSHNINVLLHFCAIS